MKHEKTFESTSARSEAAKRPYAANGRGERMVVREVDADGSVRYHATDALLRRAAKAASRKNVEAA